MALQTEEEIVEGFLNFFKTFTDDDGNYKYLDAIADMIRDGQRSLVIDFADLHLSDNMYNTDLTSTLEELPDHAIKMASRAVAEIVREEDMSYYETMRLENLEFHARFADCPFTIRIRDIRSIHLNSFKGIEGIVIRTSEVRPLIVEAVYTCSLDPSHVIIVHQENGVYAPPTRCSETTCKSKAFSLDQANSTHIDWQSITVQERPEDLPPGTSPKSLRCRVLDDIVDKVRPGDRVQLFGLVKTRMNKPLKKGQQLIFDLWIDTNYIESSETDADQLEISPEEEAKFLEIARSKDVYNLIISSIAPQVRGLERVKEAIMYFLFGGVDKPHSKGFKSRGQPNVLLVGDPGVAKSQLLKSVQPIAPRSIYTSGKGSSAAGLTAAITRDPDTGELTLEAGAMVLADQGVCLIDEFDKMNENDRSAIHEAMEQGTVSIAKAGIVATLNSRTGVLAAANPKWGYWLNDKDFTENVDLSQPIVSRFDLIFIMKDIPNEDNDQNLAAHLLNLHYSYQNQQVESPPLTSEELRKYIIFAKQKVKPTLTKEAVNVIQDFYVSTRSKGAAKEGEENYMVTITARQLEGVIRLAEARAKVALREHVTEEDARAAIDLMTYTLKQYMFDPETNQFDYSMFSSGITSKKRNRISVLMSTFKELIEQNDGEAIPEAKLIEECVKQGLTVDFVEDTVRELLRQGTFYRPKPHHLNRIK